MAEQYSSPVVVDLEGGPCSGKSSVMAALQQEQYPFPTLFLPEVATVIDAELRLRGTNFPQLAASNRAAYLECQERIIATYMSEIDAIRADPEYQHGLIITDRGPAGVRTYVEADEWDYLMDKIGTTTERLQHDYADAVVFLGSLAVANPAKYEALRDSNPARTETVEEARALHFRSLSIWESHPHVMQISGECLAGKQQQVQAYIGRLMAGRQVAA